MDCPGRGTQEVIVKMSQNPEAFTQQNADLHLNSGIVLSGKITCTQSISSQHQKPIGICLSKHDGSLTFVDSNQVAAVSLYDLSGEQLSILSDGEIDPLSHEIPPGILQLKRHLESLAKKFNESFKADWNWGTEWSAIEQDDLRKKVFQSLLQNIEHVLDELQDDDFLKSEVLKKCSGINLILNDKPDAQLDKNGMLTIETGSIENQSRMTQDKLKDLISKAF